MKAHASIAFVSVVIGIMLSIQINANLHSSTHSQSFNQWSKKEKLIIDLKEENSVLAKEVLELRTQLAKQSLDSSNSELNKKLNKANIAAGFTSVIGPGVVIYLDDNPNPLMIGDNPEEYLIHDSNILSVINQLKESGAEAISINDQRIIATSEIRCAGPTILVNLNRISPPFEIKAIGNSETLESSMRSKNGELYLLELRGMKVRIQKSNNIEIQAFNGFLKNSYAKSDS